jgi:hypothetical protein
MSPKAYKLFFLCCLSARLVAGDNDGDGFPDFSNIDENGSIEIRIPDQRTVNGFGPSTPYYGYIPAYGYAYYGPYNSYYLYQPPLTPVPEPTPVPAPTPEVTPPVTETPTDTNSSPQAASETASAIRGGLSNGTSNSLMEAASNFRAQSVHVSHTRDLFGLSNGLWSTQTQGSSEKRLESVLRAAQENGPVSIEKSDGGDTYRLWAIPFVTFLNNVGKDAYRFSNGGFAAGGQYNNDEYRYTIAAFLGGQTGKQTSKLNSVNQDKTKGFLFGSYGSWGAWNGGRLDLFYMHTKDSHDKYSFVSKNNTARGKFKTNTDLCDVMVSHNFKIPGDMWSIRASTGHFYVNSKSDNYQETGARNLLIPVSKTRTYEVYPGLGVRYNFRGNAWRLRVTGLYEFGCEYKSVGSNAPNYSVGSISPSSYSGGGAAKKNSHYLTLYATVNNFSGLKFFLGGFTTLSKKQVVTTITAKAEYRW